MAESILKIHTQNGDIPVGYPGLADKPIADKTLSEEGAFADSKAVGDKFKEVNAETDSLKEDLDVLNLCRDKFNIDGYISALDGLLKKNPTGFKSTDFIEIPNTTQILISNCTAYDIDGIAFYDESKNFIKGIKKADFNNNNNIILDINKKWKYFRLGCLVGKVKYQHAIIKYIENFKTIESNNVNVDTKLQGLNGCSKWGLTNNVTLYDEYAHIDIQSETGNSGIITKTIIPTNSKNIISVYYNIKNLLGTVKLFAHFFKKNNNEQYQHLKTITKCEENIINVDIANLSVYSNFDETKGINFVIANDGISSFDIYTLQSKINKFAGMDIAKENLSDTVIAIQNKLNTKYDKDSVLPTINNYLTSPSGKKYYPLITDDGNVIYLPVVPNDILFIGNSLLLGFGTFGMCAQNSNHDYYHYVTEYVKNNEPNLVFNKISGTDFEGATNIDTVTNWMETTLKVNLNKNRKLVIIQLGDNVNTTEKLNTFKTSCKKLLQYVRTNCPNARVCWVGEWYSSNEKQNIISNACNDLQCNFIDISNLAISENRSYIGAKIEKDDGSTITVDSAGVASHPGNKGMRLIANKILYQLSISNTDTAFDESYDIN